MRARIALGRSRRVRARPEANHIAHRDAWKGVEGTSQDDAMAKYVEKLLEVRTEPLPPFSDRRPPNLPPPPSPPYPAREGRGGVGCAPDPTVSLPFFLCALLAAAGPVLLTGGRPRAHRS